jgi:hypothetical protein
VGGHALLRNAMHFLRTDLHLERLSAVADNGSVQRLIQVVSRNRRSNL